MAMAAIFSLGGGLVDIFVRLTNCSVPSNVETLGGKNGLHIYMQIRTRHLLHRGESRQKVRRLASNACGDTS